MQMWKKGVVGAAVVALIAGVALAGVTKNPWWGRLTKDRSSQEALRYALTDSGIRADCQAKFDLDNDLVDAGAEIQQTVGNFHEILVELNFQPVGGASAQGDIAALVKVNKNTWTADSFIWITNPTAVDDTEVPPSGMQVNDKQEYDALKASLNNATVKNYTTARYISVSPLVWMYDQDVTYVNGDSNGKRYSVRLVFRTSTDTVPPVGRRDVVATVYVKNDLSSSTVESVISY